MKKIDLTTNAEFLTYDDLTMHELKIYLEKAKE